MKKTTLLLLSLAVISVILIAGCTQPRSCTTLPAKPVSTSNVTLPGPGPLVGNWNVATQEAACAAAQKNSPWYPTLLSYEAADMGRSHMYPCAQFTGSFTGPNTVYAYKSTDNYYSGSMIVTRGTNDLYVYGGASGATPTPYGSYVAKIEPGTLKELWRTTLHNLNTTGQWIGAGSIESFDGDILAISATQLYRIDGNTGAVKQFLDLPTGKSSPKDAYFNGLDAWPDGTLVMKNLARPPGARYRVSTRFFPLFVRVRSRLRPLSLWTRKRSKYLTGQMQNR